MDLSEQAVAALLAEEASQLRQAAGFQGYSAFLQKPTVRARPNKQFLAATVRNVESANRTAQVSEMWHLRKKELSEGEASDGKAGRTSCTVRDRNNRTDKRTHNHDESRDTRGDRNGSRDSQRGEKTSRLGLDGVPVSANRAASETGPSIPTRKSSLNSQEQSRNGRGLVGDSVHESRNLSGSSDNLHQGQETQKERYVNVRRQRSDDEAEPIGPALSQMHDDGEDEIDEFLHSRKKRGRGAIGSRMDEPGPFAAAVVGERQDERGPSSKAPVVLGPQLPADLEEQRRRKRRVEIETLDGEERPRKRREKGDREEEEKRARKEEKRKRKLEKERLREKRRQKRRSRDG